METIKSCDLNLNIQVKPIVSKNGSLIYETNNHQIVKVFSESTLKDNKELLKEKLSNPLGINGVVDPKGLVFVHDNLVGYTMDKIDGKTSSEYERGMSPDYRKNLYRLAYKYLKLEEIVKEAGQDVVFPELLDKVFVDKQDNIRIIGFDSIQMGESKPIRESLVPESLEKYRSNGMYTKELDIKSLICFYLINTIGLDLRSLEKKVDDIPHYVSRVLDSIEVPSPLKEKILLLYTENAQNEYLGNDVLEIAEKCIIVQDDCWIYPCNKRLVMK